MDRGNKEKKGEKSQNFIKQLKKKKKKKNMGETEKSDDNEVDYGTSQTNEQMSDIFNEDYSESGKNKKEKNECNSQKRESKQKDISISNSNVNEMKCPESPNGSLKIHLCDELPVSDARDNRANKSVDRKEKKISKDKRKNGKNEKGEKSKINKGEETDMKRDNCLNAGCSNPLGGEARCIEGKNLQQNREDTTTIRNTNKDGYPTKGSNHPISTHSEMKNERNANSRKAVVHNDDHAVWTSIILDGRKQYSANGVCENTNNNEESTKKEKELTNSEQLHDSKNKREDTNDDSTNMNITCGTNVKGKRNKKGIKNSQNMVKVKSNLNNNSSNDLNSSDDKTGEISGVGGQQRESGEENAPAQNMNLCHRELVNLESQNGIDKMEKRKDGMVGEDTVREENDAKQSCSKKNVKAATTVGVNDRDHINGEKSVDKSGNKKGRKSVDKSEEKSPMVEQDEENLSLEEILYETTERSKRYNRKNYGLLGILKIIKMSDPHLNILALGTDLTTLGLNLNSPDFLFPSFTSPISDDPTVKDDYFVKPNSYMNTQFQVRLSLLLKLQTETLFYIFYNLPRDVLQAYAASELYIRKWLYHITFKKWFTPNNTTNYTKLEKCTSWTYFDPVSWSKKTYNHVLNADDIMNVEDVTKCIEKIIKVQSHYNASHQTGAKSPTSVSDIAKKGTKTCAPH
ncbi:CCR4-NOT transcription complex subunit 2, putative (NOT2) [Plasmodium ovale curtisi]|nr:CCR4-NOT transcription complex subunit 2, putative (NOT2) [Plasmodium ovale curtisi]SBS91356.1 CCR4-NOT transcription complex subunit 2, putative (NOT2) [Plasmodium ovale curtisi]